MRNYLIMDGVDSRTMGLYINGVDTFGAGAREVSTLQIPGRNGDLILKADRLQNYDLNYDAFIYRNFDANIAALRAFLLSHTSYFRLEDTYHPNEYRMAYYRGPFTASVNQRLNAAKFSLVFNVKPQRFLKSGETHLYIADGYTVTNPTRFTARPYFELTGNGTLQIGSGSILTVSNNSGFNITIDCETMECYDGSSNRNNRVTSSDTDFPKLLPGDNTIHLSGFTGGKLMHTRWYTV